MSEETHYLYGTRSDYEQSNTPKAEEMTEVEITGGEVKAKEMLLLALVKTVGMGVTYPLDMMGLAIPDKDDFMDAREEIYRMLKREFESTYVIDRTARIEKENAQLRLEIYELYDKIRDLKRKLRKAKK